MHLQQNAQQNDPSGPPYCTSVQATTFFSVVRKGLNTTLAIISFIHSCNSLCFYDDDAVMAK